MVLLSTFVILCEGFIGVLPTLELLGEFFYSKLGTQAAGVPAQGGEDAAAYFSVSTTSLRTFIFLYRVCLKFLYFVFRL